mgnify:CR=1 FL=1
MVLEKLGYVGVKKLMLSTYNVFDDFASKVLQELKEISNDN